MKKRTNNQMCVDFREDGTDFSDKEKQKISDQIESDILAILHGTTIVVKKKEEYDDDNYLCEIINVTSPMDEELEQISLKQGVKVKLGKAIDGERLNEDGSISIVF